MQNRCHYSADAALCAGLAEPEPAGAAALAVGDTAAAALAVAALAVGESVIRCRSPLNVLKDTYDHSCY